MSISEKEGYALKSDFAKKSPRQQELEKLVCDPEGAAPSLVRAIQYDIVEGGRSETRREIFLCHGIFGDYPSDITYLKLLEQNLKAKFPKINHLRFGKDHSCPTVVVDTKHASWLKRRCEGDTGSC